MSNDETRECTLVNFRPARGLHERVYRCGTTDNLASIIVHDKHLTKQEAIFLHNITLNVDLRSKREVNLEQATLWTSHAHFVEVESGHGDDENLQVLQTTSTSTKTVLRCDLISNVFEYIDTHWLGSYDSNGDYSAAMNRRMKAIKEHGGLSGLYQAILQANVENFGVILKVITVNLEQHGTVIVNCTQGKDRTGLVIMLLQSAANVNDEDIVADFAESRKFDQSRRGSAAMEAAAEKFKMDTSVLSGAPPEVMTETLMFLSNNYGSVHEFLNEIGFDKSWRKRLQTALDNNVAN